MKTLTTMMAAAALLVAGATGAQAAGAAGAWLVTGDIAGNPLMPVCTITDAGAGKITVACGQGAAAGAPAEGTVSGQDVSWPWDAGQAVLAFKGTMDSDTTMKGIIEVSGITGNFTAKKQ